MEHSAMAPAANLGYHKNPVLDWAALRHPLHLRSDHERETVEFHEP
jgi:hypothetical protein